ncbi:MAG: helix-turn-helix domain-containing protein [Parafilimonas sp.]
MENLVFTQLSISEIRQLFRQELQTYFDNKPQTVAKDIDELLSIQQAADLIKLSVATIYGLVSRSEIPVSKKGKRLYFSQQELTEWIKAGRKKTIAETAAEATNYIKSKAK